MFKKGQHYRRRDIHNLYKGQEQGGISTPANHPMIMIFTGESGQQYGYEDGWINEELFYYTGEGQRGQMEFKAGNKAIRDHKQAGKKIYLFKYVKTGIVEFVDEMEYVRHHYREALDVKNEMRQVIVFELTPFEA